MPYHWLHPKRPPYHFTLVVVLTHPKTNFEIVLSDKVWDKDEHLVDEIVFRLVESYIYDGYKVSKIFSRDFKFVYHDPIPLYK